MSKISLEEVYKLARLCNVQLSEEEAIKMQQELGGILDFVEQLNEVDLTGLEPTYQVTGLMNVSRKDEIIDYGVSPQDLLKNAPAKSGDSLEVKRVL